MFLKTRTDYFDFKEIMLAIPIIIGLIIAASLYLMVGWWGFLDNLPMDRFGDLNRVFHSNQSVTGKSKFGKTGFLSFNFTGFASFCSDF